MIKMDAQSRQAVIKIKGLKNLTKFAIERASFTSSVGVVRRTSKEILRKPKGGRTYSIVGPSGRRRRHVASAAGETIANLTGKTRKSLGFKISGATIEFGYGVTKANAPDYAKFPEFGTSKMAQRPSLENGINASRRDFQNNFEREIGKALR